MTSNSTYASAPYQIIESDSMGLRALLWKYVKNWPWFLFSMGLMLSVAYFYLSVKQPIYRIQASLLVQDENKGNEPSSPLKEADGFASKKVVENEIVILQSFKLMDRVVRKLHLDVNYYREGRFSKKDIYNESPIELIIERAVPTLYGEPLKVMFLSDHAVLLNEQPYPLNQSVETPYGRLRFRTRQPVSKATKPLVIEAWKQSWAVYTYLDNLTAEQTSKTSTVVQLALNDAVPARGESVLNQLIDEYNQAAITDKNKVAANTLNFIEDRLSIISRELNDVEKHVENYKSNEGITDLSVQSESFLQTVQQNDALLNQVNVQLAVLNDLNDYISNESADHRGSTPATVGLNDPVLLGLIEKLSQLELQRDQTARTTSEQNPMLETLDSQIKVTKNNIAGNVRTIKAMLLSSQQQYKNKNSEVEAAIRRIPQKERSLLNITRQQTIKNDLYTYLLQKREETAVAFASAISDSRTIDAAQSSDLPIKPAPMTIYALFGFLGMLLPIALITGRNVLNNRVTRRIDVEEATQVPILGELVRKRESGSIVITPASRSLIAEQIRTLRVKLQSAPGGTDRDQVVLFTSSISGEGKSFISLNLGLSLAMVDKPTVILDMDLRFPKLHKLFNLHKATGISDYLLGEATLDEVLQPVPGYPNYFVISSGITSTNPSELLSNPRLEQLIQELRERFAYVIIDTPPVGLVSDAQLIAPLADTTFFVVRHDVTLKNHLKMINTLYQERRFQKLNIILNAVEDSDSYHHSDSYKNSYAYESAGKRRWSFKQ